MGLESSSNLKKDLFDQEDFSPERISALSLQLKDKLKDAIKEIEKINLKSHILGLNAKVESSSCG